MKKRLLVFTLITMLLASTALLAYQLPFDDSDVDFGGETVTYISWYDPLGEFVEGGDYPARLEEAMERYNIGDIQLLSVPYGDDLREVMMNRLLSDESSNDIWFLHTSQIWPLIANEAFYPMNEILPDAYYDNLTPEALSIIDLYSFQGEKYALGLGTGAAQVINYVVWNKEIFDSEGLTPLDEIYESGNWTWDAMEELAIAATTDTSGDGIIDQWGLSDIDPIPFAFTNGARPVVSDNDGNFVFGYTDEAAYAAISKVREWLHEMDISHGDWQHLEFFAGDVAMAVMGAWQINDDAFGAIEFDYGIVPLPMGPNMDHHVFPSGDADNVFVPINATDPKGLAALHNFLWRPAEVVDGREDFVLDRAHDFVSYQVLMDAYEKYDGDVYSFEGILGEWWNGDTPFGEAMGSVMWGGQSPAAAMEAIEPRINTILDEMFNN
ncbi:ABC transporter substrate-binding protein [Natronospora cellulosivora (SeqCode)]